MQCEGERMGPLHCKSLEKRISFVKLINQFNDKVKQRWVNFRKIEILLSLPGSALVRQVVKIIN